MSIGAIDTSRIEAMVAQLKAAAAKATPAGANPISDSGLQAKPASIPPIEIPGAADNSITQRNPHGTTRVNIAIRIQAPHDASTMGAR